MSDIQKFLPDLPCDVEGPIFAEPWQAQAFAMTVALHQAGLIPHAFQQEADARELQLLGDPAGADGSFVLGQRILFATGADGVAAQRRARVADLRTKGAVDDQQALKWIVQGLPVATGGGASSSADIAASSCRCRGSRWRRGSHYAPGPRPAAPGPSAGAGESG